MALTLVSTLSSETANSYVDAAYCDAYWEQHYLLEKAEQWSALSSTQKDLALIQACRVLETLRFTVPSYSAEQFDVYYDNHTRLIVSSASSASPTKAVYTQALQFPRSVDRDTSGAYYIPEAVKMAQCEQAVYLLSFSDSTLALSVQGVSSESTSVGDVDVRQTVSGRGSAVSPVALEFVKPFLLKLSKPIRRG